MLKKVIPLLHVSKATDAARFYCNQLGFRLVFAHRANEAHSDPCYMAVERDGVWLNLSSFSGDGVAGSVANLFTDSVNELHKEFVAKGVAIDVEPVDQTWGTREMYVRDSDRNCLRFIEE